MNWLLITVMMIFLISIVVGAVRGAIKILVSLVTTLITFVVVFFATPYVSDAIVKLTPLDEAIETQVSNAIANAAVSQLSGGSKGGMTAEGVRKVLGAAGLDEDTLAQYGITVEDIVNGNISKSELAKYGISGSVLDGLLSGQQESVAEAVGEAEIPREMQMEAIRNADLPDVFKDLLLVNNNSEIYKQLGVKTFAQYVGSFMAKLFIDIFSVHVSAGNDYYTGDCICLGYCGGTSGNRGGESPGRRAYGRPGSTDCCLGPVPGYYAAVYDFHRKRDVSDDRGKWIPAGII